MKKFLVNPEDVYINNRFCFKLKHIFMIADRPIPKELIFLKEEMIWELSNQDIWKKRAPKKGEGIRVMIAWNWRRTSMETFEKLIKEGVIVITYGELRNKQKELLDYVRISSFEETKHLWISIGNYIRSFINIPTVCITGSVGKTTTTRLLQFIFAQKYKVFNSGGNLNIPEYYVKEMISRENKTFQIHIQETGGGAPEAVKSSGMIMEPNAFVITNILSAHIDLYKNLDGVEKDKCSLDDYAQEEAFGVINADDERLVKHKFQHKIITCGIKNTNADYVAQNVKQTKKGLAISIKHGDEIEKVIVNIIGKHNAYNVLLACATAHNLGMDFETIKSGLKAYRGDLVRNNLMNISGRYFYIDCFNHNEKSVSAALKTVCEMEVNKGNKRIAVIGGHNHLGKLASKINYKLGLSLSNYKEIDEFFIHGLPVGSPEKKVDTVGDSYSLYKGALEVIDNEKVYYCDSNDKLGKLIKEKSQPGDLILMKGIVWLPQWVVLDKTFGTSITIRGNTGRYYKVYDENGWGNYYEGIEAVNIKYGMLKDHLMKIPESIQGKPVFRVAANAFKGNKEFTHVDFGKSTVNIGMNAFEDCINLERISIEEGIKHIEKAAFKGCINLKEVELSSVEHIEEEAFFGCKKLKFVMLSNRCLHIENNAFFGCNEMIIITDKGSYAEKWAKDNKIPVILKNEKRRIAIIFGGNSSEHEVSRESACSILKNIDKNKYDIYVIGITKTGKWLLTTATPEQIANGKWEMHKENIPAVLLPDAETKGIATEKEVINVELVWPVLHGKNGEDGAIQGLCELAGIKYIGSNICSSSVGMDKIFTKYIVEKIDVQQAKYFAISYSEYLQDKKKAIDKTEVTFKKNYPLFVKPAVSGSSVGISKVFRRDDLECAYNKAFLESKKVLVEEAIEGQEVEVAVLGNDNPKVSCVGEILSAGEWYDYESKYKNSKSETLIPANIDIETEREIQESAIRIYNILGCRGLSRVDFFVSNDDRVIFNEINTLPGFTEISMYPKLWEAMGVKYSELLDEIIKFAIEDDL